MNKEGWLLRVMQILAKDENYEDIWWRCDGEHAPITVLVNCNDLFYWACADAEKLTEENLDIFEKAHADDPKNGSLLFCCRVREMRPQKPFYDYLDKDKHHLYDECGPIRNE